jgi:FPC/CPF motif-containing protein YcgG
MRRPYLSRHEVEEQFAAGTWQNVLFAEFKAALQSDARPFPCFFAIRGFTGDQLRYLFIDTLSVPLLACSLARYVSDARQFGPNTSLIVFTRPGPVCPIDHYRHLFWCLLDDLVRIDAQPWPSTIPTSIDEPTWEFCFGGEPLFVVCTTPAHTARQSRRSTSFMITFQPR